ncbi:MAG: RNA polymerase factor sigma-54 [Pyrinomonadaceae bacterium]|nr:RNA polymerase factor sigma-54 [Pyrinomonadaceae bacterium]MCX7640960.1 RNA polymerase factor sigma-54 [Pyrinomonadaceae bacterium]MDW8305117.1 RNA polymerase factor sigma-54 [Acidobacteriota bacterium]
MSTLKLTQSLKQQLVLTPQLRQRIEMLQMTSLELSELIQQELINNPVLEEVQAEEEYSILNQNSNGYIEQEELRAQENLEGRELQQDRDPFEEVDFGTAFQNYLDPGYRTQEIEIKEDTPQFEQIIAATPKLSDHLEWQLNFFTLPEEIKQIAIAIIGNLDEDGRLLATDEELASICKTSIEKVEKAREVVMQLDPIGCGARTVQECLIVQLNQNGNEDPLIIELIEKHFSELQPHRLPNLAKQINVPIETLKEKLEIIRKLDPFPGRKYSKSQTIYVTPEIYIEKIDDDYVIYFADDASFHLRINPYYQQILQKSDAPKETKEFIKEKIRSAIELLRNIEHRRQTVYKVVECIVKKQREFLDKGIEYLKPMMMKEIAEEIGMHPSTISRVVNRKYAHTPQGIIELRRFFTEGMLNEDGEEISTKLIKLKIKKIVSEENPKKPLTDEQISKILSKEGIKISRRTVAKYREQMQIPGSRERKSI